MKLKLECYRTNPRQGDEGRLADHEEATRRQELAMIYIKDWLNRNPLGQVIVSIVDSEHMEKDG
jgi:hypothetical protein